MKEIWKNIEGYEGLYQVSNIGRVKSLGNDKSRKEKIRIPVKDKYGYLNVILCKDGKVISKKVHRLVAEAFLTNPLNLVEVNHKDEDKTNNCVSNLEWCDRKYNANYGTIKEKISKQLTNRKDLSKKVICVETGIVYSSVSETHRQTGINLGHISSCCKGKRKTAGKFHWKYAD